MSNIIESYTSLDEKPYFKIENLENAAWAFKKLQEVNKQFNEIQAFAQKEIDKIKAWADKETNTIESSKLYFEGLLQEYYRGLKADNPKAKISTPWGKVSTRKQPDKWTYNELDTIAWLKANQRNELVRIKEEIDKVEFKKLYANGIDKSTGELIPGVKVEPQEEKIVISVED